MCQDGDAAVEEVHLGHLLIAAAGEFTESKGRK